MLDQKTGHTFPSTVIESLPPSQRLHLILLGVKDVQAAAQFYEALGWQRSRTGNDGFEKFDLGGYALCLIAIDALAQDAGFDSTACSDFRGSALIYLAKTPEEVPRILARAVEAGGTLVKPATRTDWGIAGYFKDPDGHLFEVDYEQPWKLTEDHRLLVDEMNPAEQV